MGHISPEAAEGGPIAIVHDGDRIVIDMYRSHVWDASTVAAIDSVTEKYTSYGKTVEVRGLNEASQRMRQRLSGTLGG